MRWIPIVLLLLLTGCETTPVVMKNPKTGKVVQCGPYFRGLSGDFKMKGIAMREAQCIKDWKEQGFIRAK